MFVSVIMATEKKLEMKELTQKSLKQIVQLRNELDKQLYEYKISLTIRKLTQTHLVKRARRNIARINTVIKQKITA